MYERKKKFTNGRPGVWVSVQQAEKALLETDKIIRPVNGHPWKAYGRKIVCRKRFLRGEQDFQKLGTAWGSTSRSRGKRVAGRSLSCHWSGDSGTNPLK